MGKYQRVDAVPRAQFAYDTMCLFRYCKNKDAVWDEIMNYFEHTRGKGCLNNAPPPPQFAERIDADCYKQFTESIYNGSKSYWEKCGINADNRNSVPTQDDQPSTDGRLINQPSNEPLNQLVNQPSIKPSLEEVAAFIREKGLTVDAQSFYDTMEAQGWRDKSGDPVNSWQAMVRTWKPKQSSPALAYSTQRSYTEKELEARITDI